jgi:hypothetical protein
VLYGVSSVTDQWYTVNTELASHTDPAKQFSGWSSSVEFPDLSDVALTREISTSDPLPALEPLPVPRATAASGRRTRLWLEPQTQMTDGFLSDPDIFMAR